MNKTYGYVRVSTDEQTSNSQRDAIIARFPTASILADDGISGTVPPRERPALGILLNQLLQEGDTLVIYAIDRIGRNARDTLELVEELEKRKITLVSIREGVDLSSAVGQAVLGVMASFAQMERKLILDQDRSHGSRRNCDATRHGSADRHHSQTAKPKPERDLPPS